MDNYHTRGILFYYLIILELPVVEPSLSYTARRVEKMIRMQNSCQCFMRDSPSILRYDATLATGGISSANATLEGM